MSGLNSPGFAVGSSHHKMLIYKEAITVCCNTIWLVQLQNHHVRPAMWCNLMATHDFSCMNWREKGFHILCIKILTSWTPFWLCINVCAMKRALPWSWRVSTSISAARLQWVNMVRSKSRWVTEEHFTDTSVFKCFLIIKEEGFVFL